MQARTKVAIQQAGRLATRVFRSALGDAIYHVSARRNLVRQLRQGGIGIELGVFDGAFSKMLLQVARPRELHLVDVWWKKYGDYYPDWGLYTDFGRLATRRAHERAVQRTRKFESICNVVFNVGYALPYLESMPDGYFDWIYIDTTHSYEGTRDELAISEKKVKHDGIICGDDWQVDPDHAHHGVFKAVQEFIRKSEFDLIYADGAHQWAMRRQGAL